MLSPMIRPLVSGVVENLLREPRIGGPQTTLHRPVFSPNGGTYGVATEFAIISSDAAPIYYTDDGSEPTALSTLYAGPITASVTTTYKAICIDGVLTDSSVSTGVFTIVAAADFLLINGTDVLLINNTDKFLI